MLDFVEVFLGDLVQKDAKFADLGSELVMRFLLRTKE